MAEMNLVLNLVVLNKDDLYCKRQKNEIISQERVVGDMFNSVILGCRLCCDKNNSDSPTFA